MKNILTPKQIRQTISILEAYLLLSVSSRLFRTLLVLFLAPLLCGAFSKAAMPKKQPNVSLDVPAKSEILAEDDSGRELMSLSQTGIQNFLGEDDSIPEMQLGPETYEYIDSPVIGSIVVTGGMAEPHGHSWKPEILALLSNAPETIQVLPESDRNLGFDYVVLDAELGDSSVHPEAIRNLWPGTIHIVQWEPGYGLRCHIDFDLTFEYQGNAFPLYGAYAHAESFSVEAGQYVEQGEPIGVMGSTGGNYPKHVDLRLWIVVDGQRVDVSPNLIEAQLDG